MTLILTWELLGKNGRAGKSGFSLADQNRQGYGNKIPNARTQDSCRENCSEGVPWMAIKFQMIDHRICVGKTVLRAFFGYKHLLACKLGFDSGLIFLVFV